MTWKTGMPTSIAGAGSRKPLILLGGMGGTYPQGRTLPCIFPYNNANIIVSSS